MPGSVTPERVLVIDDDVAITVSLAVVLRAKGYDVVTASDGPTGLARYRVHHPQIVISDIMMPGQAGIDTIDMIRRDSADVRIVAMSGSIETRGGRVRDLACSAGADVYLHKPFEMHELLDALAHFPSVRDRPPSC
jgi:DNA-binding response OmpR family regulator